MRIVKAGVLDDGTTPRACIAIGTRSELTSASEYHQ